MILRGLSELTKRVIGAAEQLGFQAEFTRSKHIKFTMAGAPAVFFSGTPGDHRAMQNGIAKLKRAARAAEELQ